MTIFDKLNESYRKWRSDYFDNQRKAVGFAHQFAESFRQYIGAPEGLEPFPGHDMVPKYVWSCKAVLNKQDNTLRAISDVSGFDAVQTDEDGRFYFALAVRLEHGPMTWPKQWFPVLVMFSIDGNKMDLQVTTRDDGQFTVWLDDSSTWVPSFDFIAALLKEQFAMKPGEREGKKERMGFVFPAVPLPDPATSK